MAEASRAFQRLRLIGLHGRAGRSVCLALLLSSIVGSAVAQTTSSGSSKVEAKAPPPLDISCPSQDFRVFFRAFSERPDLQRKYTRLPLAYGVLDQDLIGT